MLLCNVLSKYYLIYENVLLPVGAWNQNLAVGMYGKE